MTRNSKNGKVSEDLSLITSSVEKVLTRWDSFEFQIYPGTNTKLNGKASTKITCNRLRGEATEKGNTFITKKGIKELNKAYDDFASVQFGITSKSTQSKDIDYFTGAILDYDGFIKLEDGTKKIKEFTATLEQLLQVPLIQEHCPFYQVSASGLPSIHFQLIYDKNRSCEEHKLIYSMLRVTADEQLFNICFPDEEYTEDKAKQLGLIFDPQTTTNSSHLVYAGVTPCVPIERTPGLDNEYGILIDTDFWLKEAIDLGFKLPDKKFGQNSSNKGLPLKTNTESNNENVFARYVRKATPDLHPSEYYCLYEHEWKVKYAEKWQGKNPNTTNVSGTSFAICFPDETITPYYIGGEAFPGSTLEDYFYVMGRKDGKYQHGGREANTKAIRDDICDKFGIPRFVKKSKQVAEYDQTKTIEWLCNQLCQDLKDKLYIAGWEGRKKEVLYFYFDGKIWDTYIITELAKALKTTALKDYPEVDEALRLRAATEKGFKYQDLHTSIVSYFRKNELPIEVINAYPQLNTRYFVFKNGLYDTVDKKLIPNDGRVFNISYFDREYYEVSNDNPGVLALIEWVKNWMQLPEKAEYLFKYTIMACQGRANTIETFPLIWGLTGTGKGTYGTTIANCMPSFNNGEALFTTSKECLNPTNNHGKAELENKFLVLWEELGQDQSTDMNKILEIYGKKVATSLSVNPKGEKGRNIKKTFGIIADSENEPITPKGKEGIYRRMRALESHYCPEVKSLIAIVNEHNESVFNWMIQQDVTGYHERIEELAKCEYFKTQEKLLKAHNQELTAFVNQCFEVTNNPEDVYYYDDIFRLYNESWRTKFNEKAFSSGSFAKFFKKVLKIKGWTEQTKSSNGTVKYYGLKTTRCVVNWTYVTTRVEDPIEGF